MQPNNAGVIGHKLTISNAVQWQIQGRGGRRFPIDWMHLKTSENVAPKCMIFA